MTEEELLREKLYPIVYQTYDESIGITEALDQILTLIRDAGYEPPESVREMVEKSYADGVDDTEQKYKGWKSPEEFVRCPVCGEEYSANQLMECVEEEKL